jgi:hypothetical protein
MLIGPSLTGATSSSQLQHISPALAGYKRNTVPPTRSRLLTAVPTLPSGAARSRAVLKIVILFVAEYGSTP